MLNNIKKIDDSWGKLQDMKANDIYYYFNEITKLDGAWVYTNDGKKLMFATYNYLGLLNDDRIKEAAKVGVDKYGTGTHGVRIFGGTFDIHRKLEEKIAQFTKRDNAVVFTSGYMTNLSTINTLIDSDGYVISDKLNHASIVDGCLISKGHFKRFEHNDMNSLEYILQQIPENATKLVVADAVFSMDGDILNLPEVNKLCQKYNAILMVDEAHSIGILGKTGHGIEEHFDLFGVIDIKMGTLSKTIPSVGGYISGNSKLINYIKHNARGFIFSAAMPAASAYAAVEALNIIEKEGAILNSQITEKVKFFIEGLKNAGFDTGNTETPIIPIMLGSDINALNMTKLCQNKGLFVLPVVSPAVPKGKARLRINLTNNHTMEDIKFALDKIIESGKELGFI